MQTVTLQITNKSAMKTLHELEDKNLVRIVKSPRFESPSLPGEPMDISAFQTWIKNAEKAPSISLKDAKSKWASQKKQLQRLSK